MKRFLIPLAVAVIILFFVACTHKYKEKRFDINDLIPLEFSPSPQEEIDS